MEGEIYVPTNVEHQLREVQETSIRIEEAVKQLTEMQKMEMANMKENTNLRFDSMERRFKQDLEMECGKRRGLEQRVIILEEERKFNSRAIKSEIIKYGILIFFGALGIAVIKGWI